MKALRYLLIAVTVLSVLGLSAQTRQYATTHSQEQTTYTVQVNPQMPAATMDYRHSDHMTSGSTLPQAAVTGVTTADEQEASGGRGHIRKGLGDGDDDVTIPDDNANPDATPIGDAGWTLMLLALVYLIIRVRRAKGDRTA